jgi:hypothetical protein
VWTRCTSPTPTSATARLIVTEANSLSAWVNTGDRVVAITAHYADTVTELRPADVELARSVVDEISKGN